MKYMCLLIVREYHKHALAYSTYHSYFFVDNNIITMYLYHKMDYVILSKSHLHHVTCLEKGEWCSRKQQPMKLPLCRQRITEPLKSQKITLLIPKLEGD